MPYTKLWIHTIWSTKDRAKILTKDKRIQIIEHIKSNAIEKKIYIDHINMVLDHVHILISLHPDQALSDVIRLIKGESSFWINNNRLYGNKFKWQEEYIAVSVSESIVDKVRKYIRNQEEHHRVKTFMDEYYEFMNKYGFNIINSENKIAAKADN